MIKRHLSRAAALLCLLALVAALPGPAAAAGELFFSACNDSVVTLSDSTMPTWSGGVLYAPTSLFDGSNNTRVNYDILFSYNRSAGQATLFNTRQFLTFDLNSNIAYDAASGELLNGRAILRNGLVYVPVALVCSFFGLSYSVISFDEGYMLRIKDSSTGMNDSMFIDAAGNLIARLIREYNQANQSAPTPGVRPPTTDSEDSSEPAPPIQDETGSSNSTPAYLGFRCDDDQGLSAILDTLEDSNRAAVFFFSPQGLDRRDDLLYRILGSGHSVGLLAEGSTLSATRQLLEEGNRVPERVGYTRTATALVPEGQRETLEKEGWVCWDETASAVPQEDEGAAAFANALIRQIPSRSPSAYLTLDAGAQSARVLPTLLQRLANRSYAVSVPLETRL